ncbi:MAG: G5 domain-containing protein, partial [Clostridia bacterium]|nr:G5 domain-containing protein [Clostridia bacterium]
MGYSDLKFINNTGGVVFIIAKVDGDNITVSVYGLKTDLSYEREFVVLEKIQPPQYLKTPSSELKVGEERVVVYPKEGLISQGYLKVYKDGVLIDKIPLSKDKYAPLQGEIIYGESGSIS